jgi:peroxiredoxin
MKLLIVFIILTLSLNGFSQSIGNAPDFSIQDTDGNIYNLFDELDQGKTVLLFFFDVNCGHCHEQVPYMNTIWQHYGANGESVWIWGIEFYPEFNNQTVAEWADEYGAEFPVFSIGHAPQNVPQLFGVLYTPQLHLICPDRTTLEIPFEDFVDYISPCQTQAISSFESSDFFIQRGDRIDIQNPTGGSVMLDVFDVTGRTISSIRLQSLQHHQVMLPKNASIYFVRIYDERQTYFFKKCMQP